MPDWCVRIVFLVVAIGRYAINKSIQHHAAPTCPTARHVNDGVKLLTIDKFSNLISDGLGSNESLAMLMI